MRSAAAVALLVACRAHGAAPPPLQNMVTGPPEHRARPASTGLYGPFFDLDGVWAACQDDPDRATRMSDVHIDGRTRSGAVVSLRDFRTSPSAASCAVTIGTDDGIYVGASFLCQADRSDERIALRHLNLITAKDRDVAFVIFDAVDLTTGQSLHHIIKCDLDAMRCSDPPAIGGHPPTGCE